MRQIKMKLIMIALVVSMSSQSLASGKAVTTLKGESCDQVIETCDKALESKDKQIKLDQLAIKTLSTQNTDLSSQLYEREQQLQAWYRNPFVTGTIGVLIGIVVTGYALKK